MIKLLGRYIKIATSMILIIVYCCDCNAQKMIVKGIIYSPEYKLVSNACITVKGNNKKTYSDSTGHYKIKCKKGDNLYVNFNNKFVNEVLVSDDSLDIVLHVAREMAWDGYAYDTYLSIIPSVVYNTGLNYTVDLRFSFAHKNTIKSIPDFGFRYLNYNLDIKQDVYYLYVNIRPPYFDNFFLKKFNPYIDIGYFGAFERGKPDYYNLGYGFGLSSPKKYLKFINLQLHIGYSQYFLESKLTLFNFGLGIGLTSIRGVGGSDFY